MESKTRVKDTIEKDSRFPFRPSPDFYKATGINAKRWGLIYMGRLEPTLSEIDKVACYFGIEVSDFLHRASPLTPQAQVA